MTIPRRIARLAKEQGVKVFIHVSALAANHNSSSEWARSKARGEDAVREEFPEAVSSLLFSHFSLFLIKELLLLSLSLSFSRVDHSETCKCLRS